MIIDPALLDYCTPRQRELLQAAIDHGGLRAGARALGIEHPIISVALARAKKKAAKHGYDPERDLTHPVGTGQALRGASTLYDADGKVRLQWVKSQADAQAIQETLAAAIETATSNIQPFPKAKPPKSSAAELLTVYTITDFHLGMYAWGEETGADWDMKIAESLLMAKCQEMLDGSPAAEVGIFAQLGDMLHWDGLLALTPTAKNVLDADSRFPLLVESAIRCMIWCVNAMLTKHSKVHVLMAEGNHDLASSVWLRAMMGKLYEKEPRVTVENSPHPYYVYEWGQNMLAWHHGHLGKMESLPGVFASDPKFREMWGRVKQTYIHTGHRHFQRVIEKGGAVVEQHPTLSARDAHASRLFEYSQRAAKAITYHKTKGEYLRLTVHP
jgi:hypothetical protein